MLQTIVFLPLFLLVYHYILYPLLVVVLARLLGGSRRPSQPGEAGNHDLPRVTFLVAAYNESLSHWLSTKRYAIPLTWITRATCLR